MTCTKGRDMQFHPLSAPARVDRGMHFCSKLHCVSFIKFGGRRSGRSRWWFWTIIAMLKRLLGPKWSVQENLRSDVISSDLKYVSRRASNDNVSGQGRTLQRAFSKFKGRTWHPPRRLGSTARFDNYCNRESETFAVSCTIPCIITHMTTQFTQLFDSNFAGQTLNTKTDSQWSVFFSPWILRVFLLWI